MAMTQHDKPNSDRLRMIMDTNQVSVDEVAEILSVPREMVEDWLDPSTGAGQEIPEEALKKLRMRLSVTR
jgi:DNA-binding transcriptional regulator YiaG